MALLVFDRRASDTRPIHIFNCIPLEIMYRVVVSCVIGMGSFAFSLHSIKSISLPTLPSMDCMDESTLMETDELREAHDSIPCGSWDPCVLQSTIIIETQPYVVSMSCRRQRASHTIAPGGNYDNDASIN